uniref:heterogeneous nuclear ribonucleoproteins A2/B1-like n=1 Tax=Fragaria vesca subsp. vesca TaxID=101020 RepID=UPI0005C8AA6F|nr:PREDICTED: heterogeneous nuclear ribonucleoproteins A2/B1-like [Fragaria vesca subsp. vesca]
MLKSGSILIEVQQDHNKGMIQVKNMNQHLDTDRSSTRPRQRNDSSEEYESASRTSQSLGTLPFDVDLNVDEDEQELYNDELGTSRRPIGVKKAKLKSKEANEQAKIAKQIRESNQELKELFEKSLLERNAFTVKHEQYSSQILAIQREREENKIMLTSLDTITDPEEREYLRSRKAEIMERRARQSRQPPTTSSFGNFNNINQFQGGSQGPFNSGNFASQFQFPTTFGGYGNHHGGGAGYGGVPHYGGSDGSRTSDAQGGVPQFRDSGGSKTYSGYGLMPVHGRDDDDLPDY